MSLSSLPQGKWLLHAENGACPHCVGVERLQVDGRRTVRVWDKDMTMVLDDDVLTYCMESGVDSSTCVLYLLEPLPDGDVSNLIPSKHEKEQAFQ